MDHCNRSGCVHGTLAFYAKDGCHPLAQSASALLGRVVLPGKASYSGVSQNKADGRVTTPAGPGKVGGLGVLFVAVDVMDLNASSAATKDTDSRIRWSAT